MRKKQTRNSAAAPVAACTQSEVQISEIPELLQRTIAAAAAVAGCWRCAEKQHQAGTRRGGAVKVEK